MIDLVFHGDGLLAGRKAGGERHDGLVPSWNWRLRTAGIEGIQHEQPAAGIARDLWRGQGAELLAARNSGRDKPTARRIRLPICQRAIQSLLPLVVWDVDGFIRRIGQHADRILAWRSAVAAGGHGGRLHAVGELMGMIRLRPLDDQRDRP